MHVIKINNNDIYNTLKLDYIKRLEHNFNPLSAGDAFKRIHTVFSQLQFDRNWTNMHV